MRSQIDFKTQQKVLHSPFDIETHKNTFIDYLEIVIGKSGKVYYAVPSHNGILEILLLEKKGIDFEEFNFHEKAGDLCPRERWFDYQEWLCEETQCIMVWGHIGKIVGTPNEKQLETLKLLEKEGLICYEQTL